MPLIFTRSSELSIASNRRCAATCVASCLRCALRYFPFAPGLTILQVNLGAQRLERMMQVARAIAPANLPEALMTALNGGQNPQQAPVRELFAVGGEGDLHHARAC